MQQTNKHVFHCLAVEQYVSISQAWCGPLLLLLFPTMASGRDVLEVNLGQAGLRAPTHPEYDTK